MSPLRRPGRLTRDRFHFARFAGGSCRGAPAGRFEHRCDFFQARFALGAVHAHDAEQRLEFARHADGKIRFPIEHGRYGLDCAPLVEQEDENCSRNSFLKAASVRPVPASSQVAKQIETTLVSDTFRHTYVE
jgi:hypothetical protein